MFKATKQMLNHGDTKQKKEDTSDVPSSLYLGSILLS